MKISIVIPTYNDADFLMTCIDSLAVNSYYPYEIIIINNGSDKIQKTAKPWALIKTKELIENIVVDGRGCSLKVVNWKKNRWVNPAWTYGAKIATGDYVVIANADITFSKYWDKYLVKAIKGHTIACPYERNPARPIPFALDQFFVENCPNMLKGPCFMFRKKDVPKLFPIPRQIKHWCGDNIIADRAEKMNGTVFTRDAEIFHYITQSGRRLKKSVYLDRIYSDVVAYQKYSGRNMDYVLRSFRDYKKLESKL